MEDVNILNAVNHNSADPPITTALVIHLVFERCETHYVRFTVITVLRSIDLQLRRLCTSYAPYHPVLVTVSANAQYYTRSAVKAIVPFQPQVV